MDSNPITYFAETDARNAYALYSATWNCTLFAAVEASSPTPPEDR